jgi:hypothetical protein
VDRGNRRDRAASVLNIEVGPVSHARSTRFTAVRCGGETEV